MPHFVIDGGYNGEAYNMAICGGDHGGLDGIDLYGGNIWIHLVPLLLNVHSISGNANATAGNGHQQG